MKLKLKEKPSEWQKFIAVIMIIPTVLAAVMWRRGVWSPNVFYAVVSAAAGVVLLSLISPRSFRGVYRVGMTLSFYVGQAMGMVMLTLLFFLLVTPLGLILRLTGKDLLRLKRSSEATYWLPARAPGPFDRQF